MAVKCAQRTEEKFRCLLLYVPAMLYAASRKTSEAETHGSPEGDITGAACKLRRPSVHESDRMAADAKRSRDMAPLPLSALHG